MSTTLRVDIRSAFKGIIQAAVGENIKVYERMPYEGANIRSVVLTLVSGVSRRPALGNQISSTMRGLEEHYRLQVDCYHDRQVDADMLADKVEQAIMDHVDELATSYDIHDIRKVADIDTAPPDPTMQQSRILMDFEFYTHRAVT